MQPAVVREVTWRLSYQAFMEVFLGDGAFKSMWRAQHAVGVIQVLESKQSILPLSTKLKTNSAHS